MKRPLFALAATLAMLTLAVPVVGVLAVAPAIAATSQPILLSQATFRDIGAGPMYLAASGGPLLYQVSATPPDNNSSGTVVQVGDPAVSLQGATHVWARAASAGQQTYAVVSPFGSPSTISPRDYCSVCGDGASHKVSAVLGVNTLAALADYSKDGQKPFSFITGSVFGSPFGPLFNLYPHVSAYSGDTSINFSTTGTIAIQVPVNAAASNGAGSVVVGDIAVTSDLTAIISGTKLAATGIAANTTVNGAPVFGSHHYTLTLSDNLTGNLAAASYITAYVTPNAGSYTLPVTWTGGVDIGDVVTDTGGCIAAGSQVVWVNPGKGEVRLSKATTGQCPAQDTLTFIPYWIDQVSNGMTVQGSAGSVPANTTVASVDTSTGVVGLSQALTGAIAPNAEMLNSSPKTTLSASITTGATTMTVASATGWPTSGNYLANLVSGNTWETVQVTGGQGTTTWTIVRGGAPQAFTGGGTTTTVFLPTEQPVTFSRQYTDGEAANLEMDGLALQASIIAASAASGGGSVEAPNASIWRTSSPLILPLKTQYGQTQPILNLGGRYGSVAGAIIEAVSDFGPDTAIVSCGEPTAKYWNVRGMYVGLVGSAIDWCNGTLHDTQIQPISYVFVQGLLPTFAATGVPIMMDGVKKTEHLTLQRDRIQGTRFGEQAAIGQTNLDDVVFTHNMCGSRIDTLQAGNFADNTYKNFYSTGNSQAGMCIAPDAFFNGILDKPYLGTEAYGVFCEASVSAASNCLQGVTIRNMTIENVACGYIQDGGIQDGYYAAGGNRIIKSINELNDYHSQIVANYGSPVPAGGCQWHAYIDAGYVYSYDLWNVGTNEFPVVANAFASIVRATRFNAFLLTGQGGFAMHGEGVANLVTASAANGQNICDSPNGYFGNIVTTAQWRWCSFETSLWKAREIPFNDGAATSLPLGSAVEWSTSAVGGFAAVQRGGTTANAAFAGVSLQNYAGNPASNQHIPVIAVAGDMVPFVTTGSATIGEMVTPDASNPGQVVSTATSATAIGVIYAAGSAGANYGAILQTRH